MMKRPPPPLQPPTDDLLGSSDQSEIGTHRIAVRSIDEVDAGVGCLLQNPLSLGLFRLLSEGRGSQA
jgi:hypothetical protein